MGCRHLIQWHFATRLLCIMTSCTTTYGLTMTSWLQTSYTMTFCNMVSGTMTFCMIMYGQRMTSYNTTSGLMTSWLQTSYTYIDILQQNLWLNDILYDDMVCRHFVQWHLATWLLAYWHLTWCRLYAQWHFVTWHLGWWDLKWEHLNGLFFRWKHLFDVILDDSVNVTIWSSKLTIC